MPWPYNGPCPASAGAATGCPGNNCEHFANWCATGIAVSQQVIAWISSFFRIALAAAGALFTIALAQAALAG